MKHISLSATWNFMQFQIGWFALVLSVSAGIPWVGMVVMAALVAIHLSGFSQKDEWQLLVLIGFGGWLWESCVHSLGLLDFPGHPPELIIAPLWMAGLWVNLATTLNHSLSWLKRRPCVAALFGGIGGPLAFLAGEKLGAVTLVEPLTTLLVLMVAWSVLTPLVLNLAERITVSGKVVVDTPLGAA